MRSMIGKEVKIRSVFDKDCILSGNIIDEGESFVKVKMNDVVEFVANKKGKSGPHRWVLVED